MAADGWTKEEKKREGSDHVDKYWIDPKGGKKCRSIVEVARKAYPEFLSEAAKAAPTKKKPAVRRGVPGIFVDSSLDSSCDTPSPRRHLDA